MNASPEAFLSVVMFAGACAVGYLVVWTIDTVWTRYKTNKKNRRA